MASKYQNLDVILNKVKALSIPRGLELRVERLFIRLKKDKKLRELVAYNPEAETIARLLFWCTTPTISPKEWLQIYVAMLQGAK